MSILYLFLSLNLRLWNVFIMAWDANSGDLRETAEFIFLDCYYSTSLKGFKLIWQLKILTTVIDDDISKQLKTDKSWKSKTDHISIAISLYVQSNVSYDWLWTSFRTFFSNWLFLDFSCSDILCLLQLSHLYKCSCSRKHSDY